MQLSPENIARIRRLAAEVLAAFRGAAGRVELPVDIGRIAWERAGLEVVQCADGINGVWCRNQDAAKISGVLLFGDGRILVNSADSRPRQRFTVAHELAHELLGHETLLGGVHLESNQRPGWRDTQLEGDVAPSRQALPADVHAGELAEREADMLAGLLLVPPDELDRMVAQLGPSVPLLAEAFEVSAPMMRLQLRPYFPRFEPA